MVALAAPCQKRAQVLEHDGVVDVTTDHNGGEELASDCSIQEAQASSRLIMWKIIITKEQSSRHPGDGHEGKRQNIVRI